MPPSLTVTISSSIVDALLMARLLKVPGIALSCNFTNVTFAFYMLCRLGLKKWFLFKKRITLNIILQADQIIQNRFHAIIKQLCLINAKIVFHIFSSEFNLNVPPSPAITKFLEA